MTMQPFLVKDLVIVPWMAISILIGSTIPEMESSEGYYLKDGGYDLSISGDINHSLQGIMEFDLAEEIYADGKTNSTLKLNLAGHRLNSGHNIGFIISKPDMDGIVPGSYQISGNIEGFLNEFEGVFGFANFKTSNELPFFASEGSIKISSIWDHQLKGSVDISMQNSIGKRLKIKGNFVAERVKMK